LRDVLVTAVVFGSLPFIIFWRPHLGALMWVWISMMNPHRLSFGFAYNFPFAQVIAISTLLGLAFTRQRRPFPLTWISGLMLAFLAWMSFTSLFAMQPPDVVFDAWLRVLKTQVMVLATMMLILGRAQIEQLIWTIVVSVGFYGVKGGVWTVLRGGVDRVWGPPGTFIEGNNELALALVMLLPLMYYLAQTASRRWIKYGLWGAMAACTFSILGSQSRGALLALGALILLLGAKSNRPVLMTVLLVVGLAGAVAFMPETWTARMNTIETYDQDASAVGRIQTWQTIWNMVLHRPIVGAGFDLANPLMYQMYATEPGIQEFAPHSIYFQVLGEHGFIGLALYLALGVTVWRRCRKLAKMTAIQPGLEWVPLLMRMVQVSLIGFAVGGAFLGLLHYDLPYYLAAIVVLTEAAVREFETKAVRDQPGPAPTPKETQRV
jgi:probable O-glycosylation ligase (exosortase A-associated)